MSGRKQYKIKEIDNQIRVKAIYNCYGIRETKDRLYFIDYWKKIKLRGHYYG